MGCRACEMRSCGKPPAKATWCRFHRATDWRATESDRAWIFPDRLRYRDDLRIGGEEDKSETDRRDAVRAMMVFESLIACVQVFPTASKRRIEHKMMTSCSTPRICRDSARRCSGSSGAAKPSKRFLLEEAVNLCCATGGGLRRRRWPLTRFLRAKRCSVLAAPELRYLA